MHAKLTVASKSFGVRFDRRWRIVTLVGPSGCGKSTLLRMIASLEPICRERSDLGGQQPAATGSRHYDGFQNYALYRTKPSNKT
jgi:ABC-type sugar transport system ATPase subunit